MDRHEKLTEAKLRYRVDIIDEDGYHTEQDTFDTKEEAFELRDELIKNFDYVGVFEVKDKPNGA